MLRWLWAFPAKFEFFVLLTLAIFILILARS